MPIYRTSEKNADGVYKYRVRVNYTDDAGKHHALTRICWGLRAARDLERSLLADIKKKPARGAEGVTVRELWDIFCEKHGPEVRASTLRGYAMRMGHVLSYLGDVPVTRLTPRMLEEWKTRVLREDLSPSTREGIFRSFSSVLRFAVRMDYISYNPLDKVTPFRDPDFRKKEMQVYTPEQFRRFISEGRNIALEKGGQSWDCWVFFLIAYLTGAREGEILALRWPRISGNVMRIKKSISRDPGGGSWSETPPKNRSSIRDIAMPAALVNVLEHHKECQREKISPWSEDGFVLGYSKPLPTSALIRFKGLCAARAGLPEIRIHDFRHSHASLLINAGVNPLVVSKRLGHSTVTQTLETYAHLFPDREGDALRALETAFP